MLEEKIKRNKEVAKRYISPMPRRPS